MPAWDGYVVRSTSLRPTTSANDCRNFASSSLAATCQTACVTPPWLFSSQTRVCCGESLKPATCACMFLLPLFLCLCDRCLGKFLCRHHLAHSDHDLSRSHEWIARMRGQHVVEHDQIACLP